MDYLPPPAKTTIVDHMSRTDAVMHLMRLMSGRTLSPDECEAVSMGIRAIFKRHKDRHLNWARRRAATDKPQS